MQESKSTDRTGTDAQYHWRFHARHAHLHPVFGPGWFGVLAERGARFFGTPGYVVGQTALVVVWIALNATGVVQFDLYPFILLNLAFSLQAAYAAPLILLAATRQADRDRALAEADAEHREAIAAASAERQELAAKQAAVTLQLLEHNTRLTQMTQELSAQINELTRQIHRRMAAGEPPAPPQTRA